MSGRRNGIVAKVALGLLSALLLGLGGWGGKSIISQGERVTGLEAVHIELRNQLSRIERKLDWLVERSR